jgi:hypothetical protein
MVKLRISHYQHFIVRYVESEPLRLRARLQTRTAQSQITPLTSQLRIRPHHDVSLFQFADISMRYQLKHSSINVTTPFRPFLPLSLFACTTARRTSSAMLNGPLTITTTSPLLPLVSRLTNSTHHSALPLVFVLQYLQ